MKASWFQGLAYFSLVSIIVSETPKPTCAAVQASSNLPINFTLSLFHLWTCFRRFASAQIRSKRHIRGITPQSISEMAWTCSGHSNTELISNMWNAKLIHSERVRDAMISVCFLICFSTSSSRRTTPPTFWISKRASSVKAETQIR